MAIYGSEPISPLKGDAAMVTISLKSSIIISSWVQLALSHCPLNFLQIRFEMKTSLWKFIIATALGKLLFDQFSNVYDVWEYGYGLLPRWPSMSASVSPTLPWRLLSVESWQTTEHLHFTQLSTHCSSMGQHCENIGQSGGAMWG